MQEYHLLQNQMVQPLQHVLHQHKVEQEGGYGRYKHSKGLCARSIEKESAVGLLNHPIGYHCHQHIFSDT